MVFYVRRTRRVMVEAWVYGLRFRVWGLGWICVEGVRDDTGSTVSKF